LVNSRLGHFSATPSSSGREVLHPTGASLLPKLRDNFAEFLNEGYLDHLGMLYLPTCVGFGTGAFPLPRGFSWRHGISDSPAKGRLTSPLGLCGPRIFLGPVLPGCPWTTSATVRLPFPVPPSVIARKTRYRNINLLSIAYACRPRLRSRLTLSRLALLRNPWAFGGGVSHSSFVTHTGILTSPASTAGLPPPLQWPKNALLPLRQKAKPIASGAGLSPVTLSAHEHLTSELLRTLSTSGCL
jgi:hypothetical protein